MIFFFLYLNSIMIWPFSFPIKGPYQKWVFELAYLRPFHLRQDCNKKLACTFNWIFWNFVCNTLGGQWTWEAFLKFSVSPRLPWPLSSCLCTFCLWPLMAQAMGVLLKSSLCKQFCEEWKEGCYGLNCVPPTPPPLKRDDGVLIPWTS